MMNLDEWPNCPIEGCPNKICLALNSEFCFPHTPGNKHVKHMKIDARNTVPAKEKAPLGTARLLNKSVVSV